MHIFLPVLCILSWAMTTQAGSFDERRLGWQQTTPQGQLVPMQLLQLGNGKYFPKYGFVVDKNNRQLSLWERDGKEMRRVSAYQADIGKREGAKVRLGDHKTPEGIYFLQEKRQGDQIPYSLYGSRAYTTDYPNYYDRLAGKTGSGIWLHAVPNSTALTRGSRGCVVIRDYAVLEVEPYFVARKTAFVIDHEVQMGTREDAEVRLESVRLFLMEWLRDWETQSVEQYITHYHEKFHGQNMDRDGWYQHKMNLKKYYDYIKLSISEPIVLSRGGETVVRFLQRYESDRFTDFGEKTLYLVQEDERFKIIGEDWFQADSRLAQAELDEFPFRAWKKSVQTTAKLQNSNENIQVSEAPAKKDPSSL